MTVVALGETMALVAPDPPRPLPEAATLRLTVAGAESNVAAALFALGTPAAWCSRLGEDALGRRVLAEVAATGVNTELVRLDDRPTGVMFKDPQPDGSTAVLYRRTGSAASAMDPGDADRALAIGPRLLHLTGVTPALSPSCHALVEHALAAAAEQGVPVSFDVNLRPALWPSLDEAGRVLAALANRATIVFVGGDEAARLWSCRTAEDVRAVLPAPEVLVVKDGADPVTVFGPDGSATVPALPAEVLEPVGAGDAFAGGFLHAWLDGRPADEAARLGHLIAGVALRSAGDVVVDLDPDLPDLARGPWPPPTLLEPR